MKRFTETTKWSDPWFRTLTPDFKVMWFYICENCDCSGVWEADLELGNFQIGKPLEWSNALIRFNEGKERIRVLDNKKWWIIGFVLFQYGTLSEACKPHLRVIEALKKHRVYIGYTKGIYTLEDKDKEEEEDKIEGCGEILAYLNQVAGTKFRAVAGTLKHIRARLAEGATVDQCKAVIDDRFKAWASNPQMVQYLRPQTLFNSEKFNGYLGHVEAKPVEAPVKTYSL